MQELKRHFNNAISVALGFLHRPPTPLSMSSSRHSSPEKPPKGFIIDKKYYIHGADLHFKVEHTLFRVHSYFFHRESPHYRERMAGVEHAKTYDGLSDKTAIPVRNTSVEDFNHFLWVFYNQDYTHSSIPASVWSVILNLSSPLNWDFPKMHAFAFNHLAKLKLPIVDRIILYKQCSVQIDRVLPFYAELCLRDDPLALEESVRLGYELSVAIAHVREHVLQAKARAVGDTDPIIEGSAISQEQVINLVKSALGGFSSIMDLRKLYKRPTSQPGTYDQSRTESKPSLRVRYTKQATISTLNNTTTAESSTQGRNRSTSSSSKGKTPAVAHAQKIFKRTVRQLGIKSNNPDATAATCVHA